MKLDVSTYCDNGPNKVLTVSLNGMSFFSTIEHYTGPSFTMRLEDIQELVGKAYKMGRMEGGKETLPSTGSCSNEAGYISEKMEYLARLPGSHEHTQRRLDRIEVQGRQNAEKIEKLEKEREQILKRLNHVEAFSVQNATEIEFLKKKIQDAEQRKSEFEKIEKLREPMRPDPNAVLGIGCGGLFGNYKDPK